MRLLLCAMVMLSVLTTSAVAQDFAPRQKPVANLDTGDASVRVLDTSPDGRFILYQVERRGLSYWMPDTARVRILDRESEQSADLLENATHATWSPMGDVIAFAHPDATSNVESIWVVSVNSSSGQLTSPAHPIGDATALGGFDFSPDGRFLVLATSVDAASGGQRVRIVALPVSGGPEREIVSEGPARTDTRWSPDGKFIYYLEKPRGDRWSKLIRVNAAGGQPEELASGIQRFVGVSGDGRMLAYETDGKTHVLPTDGGPTRLLTPRAGVAYEAGAWAPTGATILVPYIPVPTEMQLVTIATGEVESTRVHDIQWLGPWFPDASGLLYRTNADDQAAFEIAGRRIVKLPDSPAALRWTPDGATRWSPDGAQAVFRVPGAPRGPSGMLIARAAAPSDGVPLPTALPFVDLAYWSPDSKQVLYIGRETATGPRELRVLTLASDTDERLMALPQNTGGIAWEPSGRAVHALIQSDGTMSMHQIQLGEHPVERILPLWDDRHPGVLRPMNDSLMLIINHAGVSTFSLQTGEVRLTIAHRFGGSPGDFSKVISRTPDGSQIAFIDHDIDGPRRTHHSLTIFHLDGRIARRIALDIPYEEIYNFYWLPDGETFLIQAEDPTPDNTLRPSDGIVEHGKDIILVNTRGAAPRVITSRASRRSLIDWSVAPDYLRIALAVEQPMTNPAQILELDITPIPVREQR